MSATRIRTARSGAAALMLAGAWQAHAQSPASPATQTMSITRVGTQPSALGSPQFFTGRVRVDPLFPVRTPSRTSAGQVTFEPGARSAWHSHPLGQTLVVTSGSGWVQQEGGVKQEIKPGDVVWTPPGVKHWHGGTAATGMTHIAIQESLDGKNADWLEQVTDAQYNGN